jgi:hypothetical protein
MSEYNIYNNHTIIPNANQYFYEKKYVSICSEDRDIIKYPNASEFEIELPQDYQNVASVRLYSWSFPHNISVFSALNENLFMSFKFSKLYNPGEFYYTDELTNAIFVALYNSINYEYIIDIEPGIYDPFQMATELTNKFNEQVTSIIKDFFNSPAGAPYSASASLFTNYDRFKIIYNDINKKLWFGNNADQFVLTNDSSIYFSENFDVRCINKNVLPEFTNWGLPYFLGFNRCSVTAIDSSQALTENNVFSYEVGTSISYNGLPRFFYQNDSSNGYWLLPELPGATAWFIKAPLKINLSSLSFMYMEIEGLNCIDETSPYNISKNTLTTNETNGIVNSFFAKIPLINSNISYIDNYGPYKYFNPVAERIRKLKIKIRHHNGMLVNFDNLTYSFMIEFNLLRPQQERMYSVKNAYDLNRLQP